MTIVLGAALSFGGVGQALDGVHFLVERDLDQVKVVRNKGDQSNVVADVRSDLASTSLLRIARLFPDRFVSTRTNLFDPKWLEPSAKEGRTGSDEIAEFPSFGGIEQIAEEGKKQVGIITGAVREEFFATQVPYGSLIHEHAKKYDVDPALVAAVMETESRFKKRARSPVGAQGLMQLMPRTGRWMGAQNLFDPDQNVEAGVKYLKYLEERFDGNLKKTIAAYNAGEGTVRHYGGVPPYRETKSYVKQVLQNYRKRTAELQAFSEDSNERQGRSETR
ncbi:MAG: lytic transglycosylase domain-containing protein [Thermoanaerobaculia bacterium]